MYRIAVLKGYDYGFKTFSHYVYNKIFLRQENEYQEKKIGKKIFMSDKFSILHKA